MEIRRRSQHSYTPPAYPSPRTLLLLLCIGVTVVQNARGQNATTTVQVQPMTTAIVVPVATSPVVPVPTQVPSPSPQLSPSPSPQPSPSPSPQPSPSPSPQPSPSPSPEPSSAPPPSSSPAPEVTSSQAPTESPTIPTTDTPTTGTTSAPSSGLPMGAIIGIAAGGGAVLIVVFILLICLCWCCCRNGNREDYNVAGPWMTVRHWDPRSQHTANLERGGSMLSKGSRSGSLRSSISSIGSIIRFGSKRRSGKKVKEDGTLVPDAPTAMTVTPL